MTLAYKNAFGVNSQGKIESQLPALKKISYLHMAKGKQYTNLLIFDYRLVMCTV